MRRALPSLLFQALISIGLTLTPAASAPVNNSDRCCRGPNLNSCCRRSSPDSCCQKSSPVQCEAPVPQVIVPDAAWTWFNDPRALFHRGRLYIGYVRRDGKSALSAYDVDSGAPTTLWTSSLTEVDDHDNPGLAVLPDNRLIAFYSRHNTDGFYKYRISNTGDPAAPADWDTDGDGSTDNDEYLYRASEPVTYSNPSVLLGDQGRIFNFSRIIGWDPSLSRFSAAGAPLTRDGEELPFGDPATASQVIRIIKADVVGDRPYAKYHTDGDHRIDIIYTDGHPRTTTNSMYHLYYEDSAFYETDGTFLKTLDEAPISLDAGEHGTVVYQYSAAPTDDLNDHIPQGRAWTWEVVRRSDGSPVAAFSVNLPRAAGPDWTGDRIYYYYARYVPGEGWRKKFIAQGGRPLYMAENQYAGGMALDPDNPDVVYVSSNAADPFNISTFTDVPLSANQRYEIYRGITQDGGFTFSWTPITTDSAQDNLRPYVPRNREDISALIWFSGRYTSYTSFDTRAMGIFERIAQPAGRSISPPPPRP